MSSRLSLNVNGRTREVSAGPETPLLYVLRNDFKLAGAKFACGLEQCGACMVLLDGKARPSCRLPAGEAVGKAIRTIESLAQGDRLHAVQKAFIDEQAVQCGFCTAGFIIAAAALLERNPQPTEAEIRKALDRNLCRCGVYPRILRAVLRASGQLDEAQSSIQVIDSPLPISETIRTGQLPASLERAPELDDWVRIDPEETVTIFLGKVEYGQGIQTAISQLAANELDISLAQLRVVTADTAQTPDEGMTVGSMSLETTGNAVRIAAAEARRFLLNLALEELEARPEDIEIAHGRILDKRTGRSTTYWELYGGQKFNLRIRGGLPLKGPEQFTVLGQSEHRVDLEKKVLGQPAFLHDLDLPDMLHGRVARPPGAGARLSSVDLASVEKMPGVVCVVRDGSFLGVVAVREEQAVAAAEALRFSAAWETGPSLPPQETLENRMRQAAVQSFPIVDGTALDAPIPPGEHLSEANRTFSAAYFRPFHMHASLGASAAVAWMDGDRMTLWVHTQGVFPVRRNVAAVLGMDESRLRVIYAEGPGCYGQNGSDDAALDAALLARACPGKPIALRWSRHDEHGWEPYGPAMSIELKAALDEAGDIAGWDQQIWTYPHLGRPQPSPNHSGLLAAWTLDPPFTRPASQPAMWNHVGGHRNADPIYELPDKCITKHFIADSPLRTSSQRGLGAYANIFALESFMDELAAETGQDPVAFRLKYLKDPRAREVLETAAEKAGWQARERPNVSGHGRGIAFARYKNRQTYCAVVIDLSVDMEAGTIRLEEALIAADSGQIVNPDGLSNQLEGGLVQAASWTLHEQVRWDAGGVVSLDWEGYPILRFTEAPRIRTVLVNRPGAPFMGAGEATMGPTPAAIANAVWDAVGIRLRKVPFLAEIKRRSISQRR